MSACSPLAIAGVFGASSLLLDRIGTAKKTSFTARQRRAWGTANNYHLTHSACLLGIAFMLRLCTNAASKEHMTNGFWLVLVGAGGFAGSVYAVCLKSHKIIGMLTPTSGLILVLGWMQCGLAGLKW